MIRTAALDIPNVGRVRPDFEDRREYTDGNQMSALCSKIQRESFGRK